MDLRTFPYPWAMAPSHSPAAVRHGGDEGLSEDRSHASSVDGGATSARKAGETDERLANLFNRLNATTRQVVGAWG
jgi:hypothetical protein